MLEGKLVELEKEFEVKVSALYLEVKEKTAVIKGLQG